MAAKFVHANDVGILRGHLLGVSQDPDAVGQILELSHPLLALGRLAAVGHEVVQPSPPGQGPLQDVRDDEHSNTEEPDTHDLNNANSSGREPAKAAEAGRKDIDSEHGEDEGRAGVEPVEGGGLGTSGEDHPVLGQGDLEEDHRLPVEAKDLRVQGHGVHDEGAGRDRGK